jgi:hypothetical protein
VLNFWMKMHSQVLALFPRISDRFAGIVTLVESHDLERVRDLTCGIWKGRCGKRG